MKKTTASKKKPKSARCLVEVTQQELETSSEDESMPDMTSDEEEPNPLTVTILQTTRYLEILLMLRLEITSSYDLLVRRWYTIMLD